jgi:hypothetical protein
MISPSRLLRDSAVLLLFMAALAGLWRGPNWAISLSLSGLLAMLNFFVLGRLIGRMVARSASPWILGATFLLKFVAVTAILVSMVAALEPAAVLVGFGVVMMATTIRASLNSNLPAGHLAGRA